MASGSVVLAGSVRTAIGTFGGSLKRGIVTLCIGGGQGIALAIEALGR